MRKRAGIILVILGALCIAGALGLAIHNWIESGNAGSESEQRVTALEDYMNREIDPSRVSTIDTKDAETDEDSDPVVYLDGYDYIGYIEIPAIKLKLPVMATWDYERLNLAPCRQFGSAKDRNLVIAAHNFDTHFGKLGTLVDGDTVTFTGIDGTEYDYEVVMHKVVEPTEVEAVTESSHDLVLYTCTKGGERRIAVFCDLAEDSAESKK